MDDYKDDDNKDDDNKEDVLPDFANYTDEDFKKMLEEYKQQDEVKQSPSHKSPSHKSPFKKSPSHKSPPHKSPFKKSPSHKSLSKKLTEYDDVQEKEQEKDTIMPSPLQPELKVELDDVHMIEDMEALTPKNRTKLFINVTFLNVLIHVCILWTFLSIFFFFIASKLSSNGMNNVLSSSVGTAMDGFINKLNDKEADALYLSLKPIQLQQLSEMYSSPDSTMETNNLWDKKFSFAIAGGLLAMFLITAFVFKVLCRKNLSIWQVLIENFIMFLFVGFVEYSFFKYIASQYMPIMPSAISTQVDIELKNAF